MNPDDKARLKNLRRRVNRARNFPENTCGASRHLHLIAERMAAGKQYPMLQEEPAHCAETMLSVLESLWKARTELERLKVPNVKWTAYAPPILSLRRPFWIERWDQGIAGIEQILVSDASSPG